MGDSRLVTAGLGPLVHVGSEGKVPGMEDTLVTERTLGGPSSRRWL